MRTASTVLMLFAVLSLVPTMRAAEGRRPIVERTAHAKERVHETVKKLGLNKSQEEKFRSVWQAQAEKMTEVFGNTDLSREQKVEQMTAIRGECAPKFKEILTPEQYEKWLQMREEFRDNIGECIEGLSKK